MSRPKLKKRISSRSSIKKQSNKIRFDAKMMIPFLVALLAFLAYRYMHQEVVPSARDDLEQWFVEQGGWMSPHLSLVPSAEYHGNGFLVKGKSKNNPIIEHDEKILEIPTKLLFSMEKSRKKFGTPRAEEAIQKLISNPLDQQDIWIAMDLMIHCAKGNRSEFYPYIRMLPPIVPRLATFTWKELDWIQDEELSGFAKAQAQFLKLSWKNGVGATILKAAGIHKHKECLTLDAYNHYVSVSASRSMILDQVKYLTPMADMINHANRPALVNATLAATSNSRRSTFQTYHELMGNGDDDNLIVRADRNFGAGSALVEEYGKLDNSLYVTAFGFVPKDNAHHCVMLPVPTPVVADNSDGTVDNSIYNHFQDETVCVRVDGTIDNAQEESMIAMAVLSPDCASKEDCLRHPERESRVMAYLRKAAQVRLGASPTTLGKDEELLADLDADDEASSSSEADDSSSTREKWWGFMNKDRLRLAIQFRMEEKKVLKQIATIR